MEARMNLFPWFLFAHVLGAIAAFGPSFSMPIIGKMGGAEPQHANFATRIGLALANQRMLPLAILQGITGVGLIITGSINVMAAGWLTVGILLYAVALGYAFAVQVPTVKAIIAMTSTPPPPAPGAPAGPPPALMALIRRSQLGGMFLAGLIAVIVFLMVVKPF
jgi:hypothetical protein